MANPQTWDAFLTLQSLLQAIKIADGYFTDAGNNVDLEPFQLGQDDAFPQLNAVEDDADNIVQTKDNRQITINAVIECYVSVSFKDSQLKAHQIRADVLRALPTRTRNLPAGITGLVVVSRNILQRPEGVPYTVVQVKVQLTLVEPAATT